MQYGKLFKYYKDCFEADNRAFAVSNFYSKKVENRWVLEGSDELFNAHLPMVPINSEIASEVVANLKEYSKEKNLYAMAFFCVGKSSSFGGKRRSICAPLILYPAEIIEKNHDYFIQIDTRLMAFNLPFLERFKKEGVGDISDIMDAIEPGPMDFGKMGILKEFIEEKLQGIDTEEMLLYPSFLEESAIKKAQRKKLENFNVLSAAGFGVLRHSSATLGIMSELEQMAGLKKTSSVIKHYFDAAFSDNRPIADKIPIRIPSVLSKAQKSAIFNVHQFQESLIFGPPGTGKSYTIASMAVDLMNKGKSVLIVCKTDEAVDVVNDKIENELGVKGVTVRAGKSDYLPALKNKLQIFLRNYKRQPDDLSRELNLQESQLIAFESKLQQLSDQFHLQVADDLKWGEHLFHSQKDAGFFNSLLSKYYSFLNSMQTAHWDLVDQFYDKQTAYIDSLKNYVNALFEYQLAKTLFYNRKYFSLFLKAIKARTLKSQAELFDSIQFDKIFKALPIWLCNFKDLYKVLPLKAELFDVLIIDEASQADLATSLPAMHRAKKIVVVGDNKQLTHYSFLSMNQIQRLQKKHQFPDDLDSTYGNYRESSLFDIYFHKINNQHQLTFLNEHFRSNDSIIGFSNKFFYNGDLKVMKGLPHHKINGNQIIKSAGNRNKKGHNEEEAELLLKEVQSIIESQKTVPERICQSIGILSPFSSQVDYIQALLDKELKSHNIEKHRIKVGSPYSFQGDEKEIMLLSWVLDNQTHGSIHQYLNKTEVFNVSVTRAKSKSKHFISFDINNMPKGKNLRNYFEFIEQHEFKFHKEQKDAHDQFSKEVELFLVANGLVNIKLDYTIAHIQLDFLIEYNGQHIGIDLIGYPGAFYKAYSLHEYEILNRAGVKVLPLPYSNWHFEPTITKSGILKILKK